MKLKVFGTALLVFLASVMASARLEAQATEKQRDQLSHMDSTRVLSITTTDGSTFVGRVVAAHPESIELRTSSGRVTIAFAMMKPLSSIGAQGREDWFENPNQTRLFFAPTGRMLTKGEGYFSDYEALFPGVSFGVTDNISIGGGVSLIPGVGSDQLVYVTPKVGMSLAPRVNVAVGVIAATVPDEDPFGAIYGVGTVGDGDASVTGGIVYGFAGKDVSSEFAVLLGGEKRVSRRIALVTENYFVPSSVGQPLVSGGVRFMSEKLTVDLAMFNLIGEQAVFPGLPWVGFVYKF